MYNKDNESIMSDSIKSVLGQSTLHVNLKEGIILVTEDKIRLSLIEYSNQLKRKLDWIAPLGIFLTIIPVILTAEFKDKFLPKDTWLAIFIIIALSAFIWFIIAISRLKKKTTIDDVLTKLKKESESLDSNSNENEDDSTSHLNKNIISSTKDSKKIILNLLYKEKAGTFEILLEKTGLDYASLKQTLRILEISGTIRMYRDTSKNKIYYLPETLEESLKKYPKPEEREMRVEDIPF